MVSEWSDADDTDKTVCHSCGQPAVTVRTQKSWQHRFCIDPDGTHHNCDFSLREREGERKADNDAEEMLGEVERWSEGGERWKEGIEDIRKQHELLLSVYKSAALSLPLSLCLGWLVMNGERQFMGENDLWDENIMTTPQVVLVVFHVFILKRCYWKCLLLVWTDLQCICKSKFTKTKK